MKKLRPAFGLYLAMVAIVILLVFIAYMIFQLNSIDSSTIYQEEEVAINGGANIKEPVDATEEYLHGLQGYKLQTGDIISNEDAKSNDTESLITRSSEESNNSISVRIDTIVNDALSGTLR